MWISVEPGTGAEVGRWSRGSNRGNRGGSWRNDDSANLRGENRNRNNPGNCNDNQGFRLVSPYPNPQSC
jgi:formylglycine-generating enzyme required for sulfatase activity